MITCLLLKVIYGECSTSKKSAERKCSSRCTLCVLTLAASIWMSALERVRSCSSNSTVPLNSSNCPRTVATIICRPVKPMCVCPASNCQFIHCLLLLCVSECACPQWYQDQTGHIAVQEI